MPELLLDMPEALLAAPEFDVEPDVPELPETPLLELFRPEDPVDELPSVPTGLPVVVPLVEPLFEPLLEPDWAYARLMPPARVAAMAAAAKLVVSLLMLFPFKVNKQAVRTRQHCPAIGVPARVLVHK